MAPRSPLDAVAELQAVVTQLAPALRPQVVPNGAQYGLDVLLRVCVNEDQRKRLRELLNERASTHQQGQAPHVVGSFDVVTKVFQVESIQWLTEDEALIHELPRFIELQLNDQEKAAEITTLFLKTNGHKQDDVMAAQQCFNAAFALQSILRAFPPLPVAIHGKTIELTDASDVKREIIDLLFPPATKSATNGNSKQQGATKKQKKRKANKQ